LIEIGILKEFVENIKSDRAKGAWKNLNEMYMILNDPSYKPETKDQVSPLESSPLVFSEVSEEKVSNNLEATSDEEERDFKNQFKFMK